MQNNLKTATGSLVYKAGALLSSLKSAHPLTLILVYCYLIPLSCVILLSKVEVIASQIEMPLRAVLVVVLCLGVGIIFCRKKGWRNFDSKNRIVTALISLMTLFISLSVIANNQDINSMGRAGLQVAFLVMLGLILPVLLKDYLQEEVDKVAKFFVGIVLALSIVNLFYHVTGLSGNHRMVSPLNLQLWGIISWLLTYRYFNNKLLSFIFAIVLIWGASRFAIAVLGVSYLYFTAIEPRTFPWKRYLQTGMAIIVTLASLHFTLPYKSPLIAYSIYIRQTLSIDITNYIFPEENRYGERIISETPDLLSNRGDIMIAAIKKFDSPYRLLVGYGHEVKVKIKSEHAKEVQVVAVHNAFLRSALLYGIPYACLSVILWFLLFMPEFKKQTGTEKEKPIIISRCFFCIITLESLFFSTFWVNMTDPPVFLVCMWLLFTKNIARRRCI